MGAMKPAGGGGGGGMFCIAGAGGFVAVDVSSLFSPTCIPLLTVFGGGGGAGGSSSATCIPLSSLVFVKMISSRSSFSLLTTEDTNSPIHFPFPCLLSVILSASLSSVFSSSSSSISFMFLTLSEDLRLLILPSSFSNSCILST